jgi:hypothetical protein
MPIQLRADTTEPYFYHFEGLTRREQLVEAIANIKTFRQLFVISHDDTFEDDAFEKVTENIVLVERAAD